MTGQTALPDDMVEVFSEKPGMSVLGLIKAGMGGLLMVALIIGWVRGTGQGQNLVLLFLVAAGLIGMGGHDLAKVADRRPQVRLTPAGFAALTLDNLVVPWAAVREVEFIPPAGSSAMVRFYLKPEADLPIAFNPLAIGGRFQWTEGGARFVQIDLSPLRNGGGLIKGGVARFAPGVALRGWP